MRSLPLLAAAALLTACQGADQAPDHGEAPTSQPAAHGDEGEAPADLSVKIASPVDGWDAYGSPFDAARIGTAVTFADLAANPAAHDGDTMTVRATVKEVCQTKGCWMTFEQGGAEMRVKFQDYAFFMPKDCAGKEVIIDGAFAIQVVPADEVRHYLEDAGKYEEAAAVTEDQTELTFLASAVLMEQ